MLTEFTHCENIGMKGKIMMNEKIIEIIADIADVEIENIEDFKTVGELIEYVNDNI